MITDMELFEKIQLFEWLLKKKYLIDIREKGNSPLSDVSRGQGRILAYLSRYQDGLSTKVLASKIGVRVSSLNEILSKLENHDYITRTPSCEDKRVIINRITEKGLEAAPVVPNFSFLDCLSEAEKETFAGFLNKINQNLEDYIDENGDNDFKEFCRQRRDALETFMKESHAALPIVPCSQELFECSES